MQNMSVFMETRGRKELRILHHLRRRLQGRCLRLRPPLHSRFSCHGFVGRLYW